MPRKRVKRYKDFWYQSVVDMIRSYKKLDNEEDARLLLAYKKAIDDAFDYFLQFEYGDDLRKVIYMRYINESHDVSGIAFKLFISEDTVKVWSQLFVYKVAENVGLPKRYINRSYNHKRIGDVRS